MPEVTDHKPNTPSWVGLATPDIDAATSFYGRLFGWDAQRIAGPEMGNYTFFTMRGKHIGGIGSLMMPGRPTAWSVYIATTSADATAQLVRDAGGSVLMGPEDIPGSGRMAYFSDTTGAIFGVWQAGNHKGAGIVQEANSLGWVELQARDMEAVKPFYQRVFGWGAVASPMGPGMPDYTEWKLDDDSIAGGMPMQADMPAEVPAHWMPYFQVESADRTTQQLKELGGTVQVGPLDFPGGRFAVVADPFGANFGILETRP